MKKPRESMLNTRSAPKPKTKAKHSQAFTAQSRDNPERFDASSYRANMAYVYVHTVICIYMCICIYTTVYTYTYISHHVSPPTHGAVHMRTLSRQSSESDCLSY